MGDNGIKDLNQFKKRVLVFSDGDTPAAGGRSTGKIETRKTIHGIYFLITDAGVGLTEAEMNTDVGSVIIRANGIVIRELTMQQIIDLYQHYKNDMGAHTVDGILPIEFSDSAFDLSVLNNAYAIGMLKNGQPVALTYEINYKAGLAKADKVEVRAIVDDREMEFGLHKRIIPHTRSFASTGTQDITDLPKGDGTSSLLAYHIVTGAGTITKITVKEGSDEVYNQLPVQLLNVMLNDAGRKAQSGYFHIPFNLDNDPRSKQPLGPATAHWLVQPYWSVSPAGSYTIIEEREYAGLN